MRLQKKVSSEFKAMRVVVLAANMKRADAITRLLGGVGVVPVAIKGNLSEIESCLLDISVDVIVCEICSNNDASLILPSLLVRLYKHGILRCIPSVFLVGKKTSTTVFCGLGEKILIGKACRAGKESIEYIGGIPLKSLEAHTRLARSEGVHVEIVRHGNVSIMEAAFRVARLRCYKIDSEPVKLSFSSLGDGEVIEALTTGKGLRFVFQPQFDLSSRRVVGVETLVRWCHERYGEISPTVMIPLVNRLGLDLLLFNLVEVWAVKVMLALQEKNLPILVAVNVSAKTLCSLQFPERLAERMQEFGLPPERLKLELTEDVHEPDALLLSAALTAIRGKGFRLSLDDFGAGAATMNLLVNHSFDELKIDGAFIRAISEYSSSRRIVRGIVRWAKLFNIQLVAEGIEDEATIPLLQQLGCRIGQGYVLGGPMEFDDFLHLVCQ